MKGIILSNTRGSSGVVALISKYDARPSRNLPRMLNFPLLPSLVASAAEVEKEAEEGWVDVAGRRVLVLVVLMAELLTVQLLVGLERPHVADECRRINVAPTPDKEAALREL